MNVQMPVESVVFFMTEKFTSLYDIVTAAPVTGVSYSLHVT
jgi:hypothetical protein